MTQSERSQKLLIFRTVTRCLWQKFQLKIDSSYVSYCESRVYLYASHWESTVAVYPFMLFLVTQHWIIYIHGILLHCFRDGGMIKKKKMKGNEYPEPDYCILDLVNAHLKVVHYKFVPS